MIISRQLTHNIQHSLNICFSKILEIDKLTDEILMHDDKFINISNLKLGHEYRKSAIKNLRDLIFDVELGDQNAR